MEDPKAVGQSILSLIDSSPNRTLLGSDLALLLRLKHPSFAAAEHGTRNLRDFVRRYVPEVYESGRKGLDVMYSPSPLSSQSSLASPPVPQAAAAVPPREHHEAPFVRQLDVDAEIWKTYVSPNSRYRLFVHPQLLIARIADAHSEAPAAPWLPVPPCPVTKHLEVARQFISSLTDPSQRDRLSVLLENDFWWVPFFSVTRAMNLGKEWGTFRSRKLIAALRSTLKELGVEVPAGTRLRLEPGTAPTPAGPRREDHLLRRLALGAISKMSDSQLRLLRIPLGVIVDQLSEERR